MKTELRRAQSDLRAASVRATNALALLHEYGVPLGWPPSMPQPPAWDRVTISVILELQDAISELINARRSYDQLSRARGTVPQRSRSRAD
ncbi:hypothetical protein [Actinocatenispora comari]|nr:hypothetical protein [Actinocatenispora comari]